MTLTQAVCLVGGRGSRLGKLTERAPKPLLEVAGRPFIDFIMIEASRFGIKRLLLLAGHASGEFIRRQHDRKFGNVAVDVVVEEGAAGTAGALALAADRLDDTFFLANGDSFFDFNWLSLVPALERDDWTMHVALAEGVRGDRYGRVELSGDRISRFLPKGESDLPINAGIYLVRRRLLERIRNVPCSLENDVLPGLAAEGELLGRPARGAFIDIGIPQDFERAQTAMPAFLRRPAVFLDRDGVLNHDDNYVHRPEQVRWVEGAIDAVRWLNDAGYYVFVVTNQAGVARGLYGEEDVRLLHGWMQDELRRAGAHVDGFEYCPYHPQGTVDAYRRASEFRKPGPGMILKLKKDWGIDEAGSLLIGDRDTDLQAAAAAGIPGHLFSGGSLLEFVRKILPATRRSPAAG
ncbi:MAG: HAD-IIIA family hydrolase [Reyranella sp.]|nr:HAD-IIIA family hydrolase [Reyranella sp.]